MLGYKLELSDYCEYEPVMPVQLFSRACDDTRIIYLTDQFKARIATIKPHDMADLVVEDLRKGNRMNSDALRFYYMLMDFDIDFHRLMLLAASDPNKTRQDMNDLDYDA